MKMVKKELVGKLDHQDTSRTISKTTINTTRKTTSIITRRNKPVKSDLFANQFNEVIDLIEKAKYNALKSVNVELIGLYWKIGEYISKKLQTSEWGESVVEQLAEYIQKVRPEMKGYTKRSLYRMRQFFETYSKDKRVSALLTQISWTNHLLILSKSKTPEEREFYLNLCRKEKYSSRELERQIDSSFYERAMISNVSALVSQMPKGARSTFKDTYVLDFLDLPKGYSEKDIQNSLVANFKDFVLEFGKDFAFLGQEYRVQVGISDYFIDLLFYHRELQCLVAFELKIDDFKPEHLGKMNFYLEALDRDVKKEHENPSVGIILCKSKNKEVVEYALSRNMSPALVSEYKTKLIPKKLLQQKIHELFEMGERDE